MKNLLFILVLLVPIILSAQDFSGKWYSSFTVMGQPMRMNIVVRETPEVGVLMINPDVPDMEIECDKASIEAGELHFEWIQRNLSYTGTLVNGVISGQMHQSGLDWEVVFSREEQKAEELKRPQEPKGPFPYSTDSVQIQNGENSIGATVVLPENFDKSTPILILASGSGQQNRDSEIMGHKPFWVLADYLARNNIASVRFDDRGSGTSTGSFQGSSLIDFASDVEAVARFVRKDLKYKKNSLGLLGHSEGGMHTLIAANNYSKIDFLVQLATVGVSGKNVLVTQQYDIPKAAGSPEELCEWNQYLFEGMSEIVLHNPQAAASDSLTSFLGTAYDNAPESFDKLSSPRLQFIMGNIMFMNNVWMREFLAFQTADYLIKLELPILAIHGEKDVQVTPKTNSDGFANYPNVERKIMPGLNHLMQTCDMCTMQEYGAIEETLSPEVLRVISEWILKVN